MATGILRYDLSDSREAALHKAAADVQSWVDVVWSMHDWLSEEINRVSVGVTRAASLSTAMGELNRLMEQNCLDLEALA